MNRILKSLKHSQRLATSIAFSITTLMACRGGPAVDSTEDPLTPALPDQDGDGVADAIDICPRIPNAPIDGVQPAVCGAGTGDALARFVSLRSRTFLPLPGIHPALRSGVGAGRKHFMIHVSGNGRGQVLRPAQRQQLANLGVRIVSYAPTRTYFVSAPNTLSALSAIAALDFVTGLSPVQPEDRLPPSMRRHGPAVVGPTGAYSIEVQMYADVEDSAATALLAHKTLSQSPLGDGLYAAQVTSAQLAALQSEDSVMWIDDASGRLSAHGTDAQVAIDGAAISQGLGLTGDSVTLASVELEHVTLNHPAMGGRMTWGNDPLIVGFPDPAMVIANVDHANKTGSIMVADDPVTGFKGLLPKASLVSFMIGDGALVLYKDEFKGIAEDARNKWGAAAVNYSLGFDDCDKMGEYRLHGKQRDKAVSNSGIVVVTSAGNLGDGVTCPSAGSDFYTLTSPVAKNDIVVANVCSNASYGDCTAVGAVTPSSSAGPTYDGRLKPDVSAPGNGDISLQLGTDGVPFETMFGGTSAAAPVVTGVAGWIAEAFGDAGTPITSVPPERIKAIILHTAKDIDRPGPDYNSGYGLVQAPGAVRIAQEWNAWGREGEVTDSTPEVRIPLVIGATRYLYKATMAWTDDPGDINASHVLRNDLDLILESPSGVEYYSWDLSGSYGQTVDAMPCATAGCDSTNNVEQVVVRSTNGTPLETGTWYAVVRAKTLESSSQKFSLVLTPDCPVIIDQNVTLKDGITCTPSALAPHAVEIVGDATLNCNDHEINALAQLAGSIGIDVQATGASVHHCQVKNFDTGIRLGKPNLGITAMEAFANDITRSSSFGVAIYGADSTVRGNQIDTMTSGDGYGIYVAADRALVKNNNFSRGKNGPAPYPIAIEVIPTHSVQVLGNIVASNWKHAIELDGAAGLIADPLIQDNQIEGVAESGIRLIGNVHSPDVRANTLLLWGSNYPGVEALIAGARPSAALIADNAITGRAVLSQTAIKVTGVDASTVTGNIISGVGIGIAESDVTSSQIAANQITNVATSGFWTAVGIQSANSSAVGSATLPSAHLDGNTIRQANVGIAVNGTGAHRISGNTIAVRNAGVQVAAGSSGFATLVQNNIISGITSGITGIAISDIPEIQLTGNSLGSNVAFGISMSRADDANVANNTSTAPQVGIGMTDCSNGTVTGNVVSSPSNAGFRFTRDDDVEVTNNRVTNNTAIGIHYASGNGGSLQFNTVASNGIGISLRVGSDLSPPTSCGPTAVTALTAINNTLTLFGAAQSPQVLCDVDTVTSVIQP